MLYSAKKFESSDLEVGNVILKSLNFPYLKGYSDFTCIVARYMTMNKETCDDINKLLNNILSKMNTITELYYSEENSYSTYVNNCILKLKEINNDTCLERYDDMFLIVDDENIISINDLLLKEYYAVITAECIKDVQDEMMNQLNNIKLSLDINYKLDYSITKGRITKTGIDVELANAWNLYKQALIYIFNCYSFKNNCISIKSFDKIEINKYVKYADSIIERFLKINLAN
jgi:hypothetical protein